MMNCVNKNAPNYGQLMPQALVAQETIALYNWWKYDRPNPHDASGLTGYYDECHKAANVQDDDSFFAIFNQKLSDDERAHQENLFAICGKMEKEQEEEDVAMLIRLINIRHGLWT